MSKKRRTLSADDLAAWRAVARTATPLPGKRAARPAEPAPPRPAMPAPKPGPAPAPALTPFRIGERARAANPPGHDATPTLERHLADQPLAMDARTYRHMRRGKLRPERKIDLHGMSLASAHPALTRFVIGAHRDGCRLVLVVTGKGKPGRDDGGPIPTPRGLLRAQVPIWLAAPPLGPLVLQVTEAHRSHGGSGACYVYLARRR